MGESAAATQALFMTWLADALPGTNHAEQLMSSDRSDQITVDGRTFTADELAAVLATQVQVGVDTPRFDFTGSSPGVYLPVFAWRMTVHRQVRAVLALREADLPVEMMVNARVALEHAVLLRAVGDAEQAGAAQDFMASVTAANQQNSRTMLKALTRLDAATGSEYSALLAAIESSPLNEPPPKASGRTWNGQVSDLFRRVAGGERFYPTYRALSEVAHAGVGSAQPFLQRLITEGCVSRHPVPPPAADIFVALVWALCTADDVLQIFLTKGTVNDEQTAALAKFGLAPPIS